MTISSRRVVRAIAGAAAAVIISGVAYAQDAPQAKTTAVAAAPAAKTAAGMTKPKATTKVVSPCKGLVESDCKGHTQCTWIMPTKSNKTTGKVDNPYCRKLATVAKKPATTATITKSTGTNPAAATKPAPDAATH